MDMDRYDLSAEPYKPPSWASELSPAPETRMRLANLPTPLQLIRGEGEGEGAPVAGDSSPPVPRVLLKRDDLSGAELSGNKTRKLEFLVAEARAQSADVLVTAGAVQSNHCRATVAAASRAGLACALLLRVGPHDPAPVAAAAAGDACFGAAGNLLLDRLLGAECWFVTAAEWKAEGPDVLLERLRAALLRGGAHRRPYVIPVGGSNAVGAWGYLQCVDELARQLTAPDAGPGARAGAGAAGGVADIAFACGSGGTAAGLAIGAALCPFFAGVRLHAFMVCDNEAYFQSNIDEALAGQTAGWTEAKRGALRAKMRAATRFHDALQGGTYGVSTRAELAFLARLARRTGVLLDPTYGGKAFFALARLLSTAAGRALFAVPERVLFLHTGGLFSWFAKEGQLLREGVLEPARCHRLEPKL